MNTPAPAKAKNRGLSSLAIAGKTLGAAKGDLAAASWTSASSMLFPLKTSAPQSCNLKRKSQRSDLKGREEKQLSGRGAS